jgi:hypothetical protein
MPARTLSRIKFLSNSATAATMVTIPLPSSEAVSPELIDPD